MSDLLLNIFELNSFGIRTLTMLFKNHAVKFKKNKFLGELADFKANLSYSLCRRRLSLEPIFNILEKVLFLLGWNFASYQLRMLNRRPSNSPPYRGTLKVPTNTYRH